MLLVLSVCRRSNYGDGGIRITDAEADLISDKIEIATILSGWHRWGGRAGVDLSFAFSLVLQRPKISRCSENSTKVSSSFCVPQKLV